MDWTVREFMKKLRHLSNKNKQIDREFYETIRDILHHPAVQQMRIYMQHSGTNCYEHCLHVAYFNYRICRRPHLDARSAAERLWCMTYSCMTGEHISFRLVMLPMHLLIPVQRIITQSGISISQKRRRRLLPSTCGR